MVNPDGNANHDPSRTLRLGFAGTPAFAARILATLLQAGREPITVYTQPDRPAGRRRQLQAGEVKQLALAHGLSVRQPASLKGHEQADALAELDLDVLVVAAYGLILPESILELPRFGCINVHASLLPRWRGAAPVERAIMAGDSETGVSIMHMERGLDTGPVYLRKRLPIGPDSDGPTLEAQLADLGGAALRECLAQLPGLKAQPQSQTGVTYAAKLTRADAAIDWSGPAAAVECQVRALVGRMPAETVAQGLRVKVLKATAQNGTAGGGAAPGTVIAAAADGIRVHCGEGTLTILEAQLAGKKPASTAEILRGHSARFTPGTVLEQP
jgi:methionyl-tRNA formyltransferase